MLINCFSIICILFLFKKHTPRPWRKWRNWLLKMTFWYIAQVHYRFQRVQIGVICLMKDIGHCSPSYFIGQVNQEKKKIVSSSLVEWILYLYLQSTKHKNHKTSPYVWMTEDFWQCWTMIGGNFSWLWNISSFVDRRKTIAVSRGRTCRVFEEFIS